MPVSTQGSLLAGRYRVVRRLGAGGMASVLLCRDERLDREVAVKRLHADSPGEIEQRFVREAKLGASLNHSNLVSVYDTVVEDEGVLIVMEYVRGESLAVALLRGPMAPDRVARLAGDLGEALDHAHGHGVVHRDVKPGNVLLREDGVAKLADLGIAVSIDQTRVTQSGIVLGSAAYMAPEQLDGAEIGPAADVYSLATVCFEALAGSKARPGRTPVEIAHSVAVTPPPDVRAHVPELSEGVADALARGMARDPADRPRTAGRLAAELAEALRRPAPVEPPTAPAAGRGRPLAGVLAAGLIALAAAAVVAAVLLSGGGSGDDRAGPTDSPAAGSQTKPDKTTADQQPAQPAPAEPAPTDSTPADSPPADQPEVDPALGIALNEQGFALMGQGDFAGAVPILRRAVASWPQDSTDLEYAYALFNLGKALNRSGQAAAAIPYLEQRLGWPNQRGVVKQELRLARQNAGQG